jgi:hypothetical protein
MIWLVTTSCVIDDNLLGTLANLDERRLQFSKLSRPSDIRQRRRRPEKAKEDSEISFPPLKRQLAQAKKKVTSDLVKIWHFPRSSVSEGPESPT